MEEDDIADDWYSLFGGCTKDGTSCYEDGSSELDWSVVGGSSLASYCYASEV